MFENGDTRRLELTAESFGSRWSGRGWVSFSQDSGLRTRHVLAESQDLPVTHKMYGGRRVTNFLLNVNALNKGRSVARTHYTYKHAVQ